MVVVASSLWFGASAASATYSIIALDLDSGHAGGAGTSCVGANVSVSEIFGAAPGFGVAVAQAALNAAGRDRAVELLQGGTDAPAVIADITAPEFDLFAAVRQYAVIDARGNAAGFTGASTMPYADDVQGRAGDVVYSVQGNILTGAAVLEQAAGAFEDPGCDLADTLMRALEAGARDGQGDSRCTPEGIPSDGAFVRVHAPDAPGGAPYLDLMVDDTRPEDPLVMLRAQYDAWRAAHPCPAGAQPDGGAGGADAARRDAGPPMDPPRGMQAGNAAPVAGGSGGGPGTSGEGAGTSAPGLTAGGGGSGAGAGGQASAPASAAASGCRAASVGAPSHGAALA